MNNLILGKIYRMKRNYGSWTDGPVHANDIILFLSTSLYNFGHYQTLILHNSQIKTIEHLSITWINSAFKI